MKNLSTLFNAQYNTAKQQLSECNSLPPSKMKARLNAHIMRRFNTLRAKLAYCKKHEL